MGNIVNIAWYKYFWALRALLLKPFLGKMGNFSYMGEPLPFIGMKKIFIDDRVRIQPGARFEAYEDGYIKIAEDVSIGQNFHCTSAGRLEIGAHTTILGNAFVTNIDHEYREIGVHILRQPMLVKNTIIGENCFIGYGAAIQAGTTLGKQCIIGANSVVRGHFPDYCVIVGAPGKIVKKYNAETEMWEKIG